MGKRDNGRSAQNRGPQRDPPQSHTDHPPPKIIRPCFPAFQISSDDDDQRLICGGASWKCGGGTELHTPDKRGSVDPQVDHHYGDALRKETNKQVENNKQREEATGSRGRCGPVFLWGTRAGHRTRGQCPNPFEFKKERRRPDQGAGVDLYSSVARGQTIAPVANIPVPHTVLCTQNQPKHPACTEGRQ